MSYNEVVEMCCVSEQAACMPHYVVTQLMNASCAA